MNKLSVHSMSLLLHGLSESIQRVIYLSMCLSVYLSVRRSSHLTAYLSINLSTYPTSPHLISSHRILLHLISFISHISSISCQYRLVDTGQGYHRLQSCPHVSAEIRRILSATQKSCGAPWVGLSVIHLGDRDVPNALVFIDKYTQVAGAMFHSSVPFGTLCV